MKSRTSKVERPRSKKGSCRTVNVRNRTPESRNRRTLKVELIVSDFDGTLRTAAGSLSAPLRRSIRRFTSGGGSFVVATARPAYAVGPYLRTCPDIRYLILCNGGWIEDRKTGRTLFARPLGAGICAYLARKYWDDPGFLVMMIGLRRTLVSRVWPSDPLARYQRELRSRVTGARRLLGLLASGHKVMNVEIAASPADLEKLRRDVSERFGPAVTPRLSWPGFMELYPGGVSKGRSALKVARLLGADARGILAFGDADNDLELFAAGGVRVAVANATRSLKARADHVAGHYKKDGVAKFMDLNVLGPG
jgi:Cof subfamily protein (haloacid dehalogenase superfamily)